MALLALALVALLPGLLVVRAPWTAVPALSLAFWAVSAWWAPASLSRTRLVSAALVAFTVLLLLRVLPKHEVPPPPEWTPPPRPAPPPRPGRTPPPLKSGPALLIAVAALLLLAPVGLWRHAPGARLAFQTTAARLVLWRDGIPPSAEPLLPLAPFGAHAPAIATLSADLSRLSGLDPAQTVLLVVVSAAGLALVGLFALCATRLRPWAAALAALWTLAVAPWPGWLEAFGPGEALVALAFLLPAVALLVGRASRSSAVAAGLLLAAGALAHPLLALLAIGFCCGVVLSPRAANRRPTGRRLSLAMATAALLAGPGLVPLVRALSPRELAEVVGRPPTRAVLDLAIAVTVLALAAALADVVGCARPPVRRAIAAVAAVLGATLLVTRVHGWIAAGQLPQATLSALAGAAARTSPLDAVCAPDGVRDWVPALVARAPGDPGPWIPVVYSDEWRSRDPRSCAAAVTVPR